MARMRKIITLDEKIEKAQEAVEKTKARNIPPEEPVMIFQDLIWG